LKEPVNAGPEVYGVAENERLRDVGCRRGSGWNEPRDVEERGARGGVAEELGDVANVGVVDGEMTADVTAWTKPSEIVTLSKVLSLGSVALTATQGTDEGRRWRSWPISL